MNVEHRSVIAALVVRSDCVLLTRRSAHVGSDSGLWHCVTGYLEPDVAPLEQMMLELHEELGLQIDAIVRIDEGEQIMIDAGAQIWHIHPYLITAAHEEVLLNWENDAAEWVHPENVPRNIVAWLPRVAAAFGYNLRFAQTSSPS